MANPQRRTSQRPSRDSSVSSHRGENVFSDENEIESFGVADGYRPTFTLQDTPSSHRTSHQPSSIQNTTSPPRDTKKKPISHQQSSQPLISRNSFSLQNDAQYSDIPRRVYSISSPADDTDSPAARPLSLLSRQSTYARPQSTYTGPSAPSHPYGMYPQDANEHVRHASVASSHRPVRERSYLGPDRPAHPYGMYPQNTVSDNDTEALAGSEDIASVGFPGLRQQFARRLGPTGDDADDIIGPDGHTEQLPPYTKYANVSAATEKIRMASIPQSPVLQQESSQTANFATSDNDALLSPAPTASTQAPILRTRRFSGLGVRDRLTEKAKRRTCFRRMPCWAVALIIFLMVALGAVGGAVIGHFLPSWKHHDRQAGPGPQPDNGYNTSFPPPAPTTTVLPPALPSNLTSTIGGPNAAPTGAYTLIISSTPQKSNTCLTEDLQKVAWDCTDLLQLQLNVENPYNSRATVSLSPIPVNGTYYGDQNPPPIQAKIDKYRVKDPDNPEYGEAYYFSATYDKSVILHQTDLTTSPPPSKRSEIEYVYKRSQLNKRGSQIQNNDMVWNCTWSGTLIDGFIYVDESSTSSSSSPAPTSNTKRDLLKRDSYSRKMKIREIRQSPIIQPQCVLMQYVNQTLVPPSQPPPPIPLEEIAPPTQHRVMSHWHRDWTKHSDKDYDGNNHRNQMNVPPTGFCDCTWMFG